MSKGQIEKKVEYMQKSNPIMKGKIEQKKITGWKKEKSSIWKRKMKMKGRIEEGKNRTKEKKSSVG